MYTGYPNVDRSTTDSASSVSFMNPSSASSAAQIRPSSSAEAFQIRSPTSQVMSQSRIGARDLPVSDRDYAIAVDFDGRRERAGADLVRGARLLDPLGHALRDEARAARRVEELDDERRVAMLRSGDLRASLAQARDDDFRERDVRDAVLRERRSEVRRRDPPTLRPLRPEEERLQRAPHRLPHPILGP